MKAPGPVVRVLVGGPAAADAWMRHHGIRPGGPAAPIVVNSRESCRRKLHGFDADRFSVVSLHDADLLAVAELDRMTSKMRP